uniref:Homeobox-leucine zipper protein HDG8-like n=3 Tax=Cicer arietinum TaxID=3827 RepID=A0A3Q7YFT2_CICAR
MFDQYVADSAPIHVPALSGPADSGPYQNISAIILNQNEPALSYSVYDQNCSAVTDALDQSVTDITSAITPVAAENDHLSFSVTTVATEKNLVTSAAAEQKNCAIITSEPSENVPADFIYGVPHFIDDGKLCDVTPPAHDENVVAYGDTPFLDEIFCATNGAAVKDIDDISALLTAIDQDIPAFEINMFNLSNVLHDTPVPTNHENIIVIDEETPVPAQDPHMSTIDEDFIVPKQETGEAPHPITIGWEMEKQLIMETANNAMEELIRLLKLNEPFWFRSTEDERFVFQRETYDKIYHKSSYLKGPRKRTEATKDSVIVSMGAAQLVDMFLNSEKWMNLFPTIVKDAVTVEVYEEGSMENRNGALQLMNAKMHILSPLVPTRVASFLRYCKQIEEGVWVIADVSVSVGSILDATCPPNVWKFPSGCMIQELTNHSCRVSWVEHIEVDDKSKTDLLFRKTICSNNGYRAERWLLTLERMCQRFSTHSIQTIPSLGLGEINTNEG